VQSICVNDSPYTLLPSSKVNVFFGACLVSMQRRLCSPSCMCSGVCSPMCACVSAYAHAAFVGTVSCPLVSSRVLSYPLVSCPVVSCRVLSCPVVSCRVLSCPVVSCRVLSCRLVSCPLSSRQQLRGDNATANHLPRRDVPQVSPGRRECATPLCVDCE
jgi:hypothetical protein